MTSPTPPLPLADLPAPDDAPLDLIFIEGFTADTVIGIDTGELHAPQPLVIDLWAGVPRPRACDTDQIGDTLHYGELRSRLLRFMAEHRLQLLEAFAEAVCDIVLHEFGAQWVRLKVVKPRKFPDLQAVGVMIERRAPRGPAPRGPGAAVLRLIGSGMVPDGR